MKDYFVIKTSMEDQHYTNKLNELTVKYVDLRDQQWQEKIASGEEIETLKRELIAQKSKHQLEIEKKNMQVRIPLVISRSLKPLYSSWPRVLKKV